MQGTWQGLGPTWQGLWHIMTKTQHIYVLVLLARRACAARIHICVRVAPRATLVRYAPHVVYMCLWYSPCPYLYCQGPAPAAVLLMMLH